MAKQEGWKLLGYESFQAWAKGEFDVSWQQVYNIKAAAEFDAELSLYSPLGEIYHIPVKHATQLRKLKTPESRVRAYQMAEQQALAQGKETPTERIVEQVVYSIKAEETVFESAYQVVRQALAEATITAPQARQITLELDRLKDEPARAFVQKLMASYGLNNPDLVYPLGHKFLNERQKGKLSYVLDEIEATNGRLAGTPLARAHLRDLQRANAEAQQQHIAESEEQRHQQMLANGEVIPEQFALTLWKHAPVRSAKELIRLLPPEDLQDIFELLGKHLGYTESEAVALRNRKGKSYLYETVEALDIQKGQTLEMLVRIKVEEEKGEEDVNLQ